MKHNLCISIGFFLISIILIFWGTTYAQECSRDEDCHHINDSICSGGNCTCPETASIFIFDVKNNASLCVPALNITQGNCSYDLQCSYERGRCLPDKTCGCALKFVVSSSKCIADEKTSVIPIAVGITIGVAVFGTLCLYLYLSRRKKEWSRRTTINCQDLTQLCAQCITFTTRYYFHASFM